MDYILALNSPDSESRHALDYAATLAINLGCHLQLNGYYFVPVTLGDMPLLPITADESRRAAEVQLDAAAERIRHSYPELRVNTDLVFGDAELALTAPADRPRPLLTVIPNTEIAADAVPMGFDSDMLLRLPGPILCISSDNAPQFPRRISVAVSDIDDLPELNEPILDRLRQTGELELSFFNVRKTADQDDPGSAASALRIVIADEFEEGIRQELQRNAADWLVISPKEHGFFYSLLHRNHTAHLLHDIRIPVLALGRPDAEP